MIIAIAEFLAAYVLLRGIYNRDEISNDQSRIGWSETGEPGFDDGSKDYVIRTA